MNEKTAVAVKESFSAILNSEEWKKKLNDTLGSKRETFVTSIIELFSNDKDLQQCSKGAIVTEAFKATALGLPISKTLGAAYIVVYKNNTKIQDENGRDKWVKIPTPTFVMGYRGYIQLAIRSGRYKILNADAVYEGELVRKDKLSGHIDLTGEKISDKVIGYFSHFELHDGFQHTLYMSVEEMAKYAKKYSPSIGRDVTVDQLIELANSESSDKKSVGWLGNFKDMAIKTVLRRLISHYGLMSVEMQTAFANDKEPSAPTREEIIHSTEVEEIELEEVVDEETGEVKESQVENDPY